MCGGFRVGVTSVPPLQKKTAACVGLSVLSGVYEKRFEDGTLVEEALLPPFGGRGGVTLWAMFCSESLRSSIGVSVYFTRPTQPIIFQWANRPCHKVKKGSGLFASV